MQESYSNVHYNDLRRAIMTAVSEGCRNCTNAKDAAEDQIPECMKGEMSLEAAQVHMRRLCGRRCLGLTTAPGAPADGTKDFCPNPSFAESE